MREKQQDKIKWEALQDNHNHLDFISLGPLEQSIKSTLIGNVRTYTVYMPFLSFKDGP